VIEATVFRTISGPVGAWELLLPAELLRLPEELARVDALLDDPAFFARSRRTSIRCQSGRLPRSSVTCG
jgi:IS5 family transposase